MVDLHVEHYFTDGMYARKMTIPKNAQVPTHRHVYDHFSVLSSGKVMVTVDDVSKIYSAPAIITIKKNQRHTIRTFEESVWICMHATRETEISKIDNAISLETA